jgi:starch phosphorylase
MIDSKQIIARTQENLKCAYQIDIDHANALQLHNALSKAVMAEISEDWIKSKQSHNDTRRAYYFSAEFLTGRMVYNNLYCLGVLGDVRDRLFELGVDLTMLEDIEDAALGNGGLGRLAACFLDSAATHNLPLDGYGIRYKFGLFKQLFVDGMQYEVADDWQSGGDPWSCRRDDRAVIVEFADQKVCAVPYDMPVFGYGTSHMSTLRLWQSEAMQELDFAAFNNQDYTLAVCEKNMAEDISRVLYPNDSDDAGKKLRLKQQYFLSSASLQDIIARYKRTHGDDFSGFANHCAIQLNDTHPVVSIPELIRLLTKEGMSFDDAFNMTQKTFSYTNHTVMAEALEKWTISLMNEVIPEIAAIISQINDKLCMVLNEAGVPQEKACGMRIIDCGTVHMARLAVYMSSYVNGVAEIHTEILKRDVFKDWYELYPQSFQNKTNGVTQRRWLGLSNPELTALIKGRIGDGFLTDLSELEKLKNSLDDDFVRGFNDVKLTKKRQLAALVAEREGVELPPEFIFDVQVKRLHEYKRQLLNAFSILDIYFALKDGTLDDFQPTVFLFGAKAAPGYFRAKAIIKFINEIANLVNADDKTNDRLRVVFVQNYNCSYAEAIIPAADVSEQISTAGTEASGTGNMKLMLSGAVTLGTYDGANIEIVEQAGEENNYIFGARVEDIERERDSYDPKAIYDNNPRIKRMLDTLVDGTLSDDGCGYFKELYDAILKGASWHKPDHYFLLLDLMPYIETKLQVNRDYSDRMAFGRKCLMNVASAGKFSSDRTVKQYVQDIWHL